MPAIPVGIATSVIFLPNEPNEGREIQFATLARAADFLPLLDRVRISRRGRRAGSI